MSSASDRVQRRHYPSVVARRFTEARAGLPYSCRRERGRGRYPGLLVRPARRASRPHELAAGVGSRIIFSAVGTYVRWLTEPTSGGGEPTMSRFTHTICERDWIDKNSTWESRPEFGPDAQVLVDIRRPVLLKEPRLERCCFCGEPTIFGASNLAGPNGGDASVGTTRHPGTGREGRRR
jgi:hypothetical protein